MAGASLRRALKGFFASLLVVSGAMIGITTVSSVAGATTAVASSVEFAATPPSVLHGSTASVTISGLVHEEPHSGTGYPTGTVTITVTGTAAGAGCTSAITLAHAATTATSAGFSCTLAGSAVSSLGLGTHVISAAYSGGASSTGSLALGSSTAADTFHDVTPSFASTSTTLTPVTSPVPSTTGSQTFVGHVTGQPARGYPTGSVSVKTTTGNTLCTATLGTGSGDVAPFTCTSPTPLVLFPSTYAVTADYAGGTSSTGNFLYGPSTSAPQPLVSSTTLFAAPTGTGACTSPTAPCMLHTAVLQAEQTTGAVTIELAPGTYTTQVTVAPTSTSPMTSLTIAGPAAPAAPAVIKPSSLALNVTPGGNAHTFDQNGAKATDPSTGAIIGIQTGSVDAAVSNTTSHPATVNLDHLVVTGTGIGCTLPYWSGVSYVDTSGTISHSVVRTVQTFTNCPGDSSVVGVQVESNNVPTTFGLKHSTVGPGAGLVAVSLMSTAPGGLAATIETDLVTGNVTQGTTRSNGSTVHSAQVGIAAGGTTGLFVENDTIATFQSYWNEAGIWLDAQSPKETTCIVATNTIVTNDNGVVLAGASNCTVTKNTIIAGSTGVVLGRGFGPVGSVDRVPSSHDTVTDNTITGTATVATSTVFYSSGPNATHVAATSTGQPLDGILTWDGTTETIGANTITGFTNSVISGLEPSFFADTTLEGFPLPRLVTLYVRTTGKATAGCTGATLTPTGVVIFMTTIACGTLGEAVGAAESPALTGDAVTITVGAGTYVLASTVAISYPTLLAFTIVGKTGASKTTVTGAGKVRDFSIPSATLTIKGLSIANGMAASGPGAETGLGGGIYTAGTLTLTHDEVMTDTAQIAGGGVYNGSGTLKVAGGDFSGDQAPRGGGLMNDAGQVTATGTVFSNDTSTFGPGGGFANLGTAKLKGGSFSSDRAETGTGGGIVNFGTGTLSLGGVAFATDHTNESGGAIANVSGVATLTGSTISTSTATHGGGIVNRTGGTLSSQGVIVQKSNATTCGGGIYNDASGLLRLYGGTVKTDTSSGNGGGLCNSATSHATLTTTYFFQNTATGDGGGIYNDSSSVVTTVNGSYSSTNKASDGGGVYNTGATFVMTGGTLSVDRAALAGGGLYNATGATATLQKVTISGDSATGGSPGSSTGGGGGIYNTGATLTMTNGTLSGDTSTSLGGGLDNGAGGTATLTSVSLDKNTAEEGGGIYNVATLAVTGGAFTANKARYFAGGGGGLANDGPGTAHLTGVSMSGNAANAGAGIYNEDGGVVTLAHGTLTGNTAQVDGGGLYTYEASSSVTDSTFARDVAKQYDGGAIYNEYSTLGVSNTTFATDSAVYGGAVDNTNLGKATLRNVTFFDNKATDTGGALQNYTGTVEVTGATFSNNSAPGPKGTRTGGGGIGNDFGGAMSVSASIFTGSTCLTATGTLSGHYNVTTSSTCEFGFTWVKTTGTALDLATALAANTTKTGPETLAIGPTSPAIDEVTVGTLPALETVCAMLPTDERGLPRPGDVKPLDPTFQTSCDAGAYELQHTISTLVQTTPLTGTVGNGATGHTFQLAVTAPAATTGKVTFTLTKTSVTGSSTASTGITVGPTGLISVSSTAQKGVYTLTGTDADPLKDSGTWTFTLTITKATPVITWPTPASIPYGTKLSATQLDATAKGVTGTTLAGSFTYTPTPKSTTLLTAGTHTLKVTFTPTTTSNYVATTKTVTLTVTKAVPTITWATPAAIVTGTALSGTQLDATAKGVTGTTLAGTFTYTPPSGTKLSVGSHTLKATFTPTTTTNYQQATKTVPLTVSSTSSGGGGGSTPPASSPSAPTAPSGTTSHHTCSVSSGTCHASNDGVTVTASTGPGALTVSQYGSDPKGAPSFSSTGEYFDVELASSSSFTKVVVVDCNLNGGTKLYWWNTANSTWEPVSPVTGPSGTPACLTATLSSTSSPTIAQLTATVFAVGTPAPGALRVAGATPDATAAAEFERAFPSAKDSCPTTRDAVLATTKEYQDALSSQFLAGDLTTGTLLTPTASLSSVTATTLEHEGISTVYVVGGPLAVTTTVVKAIEALTAFGCGATAPSGKITVKRLFGATKYATAAAVATFVGTAGTKAFPGAYAGTNATGGTGRFNDTPGKGSAAPAVGAPTAILASGTEFQDAQSASVIAYRTKLPLLLTSPTSLSPTALAAMQKLGVKQVILMGGSLAVSDTVQAALAAAGISVLRIAGKDATDTAVNLARFEVSGATDGLGWTPGDRAMVARSTGFTDGLAGAVLDNVHATATGPAGDARPLLLTEGPSAVGTYLTTFLETTGHSGIEGTKAKTLDDLTVLGGTLALTTTTVNAMQTDLSH